MPSCDNLLKESRLCVFLCNVSSVAMVYGKYSRINVDTQYGTALTSEQCWSVIGYG